MKILYFDFFQISRNIRFFDFPFKENNGCVVIGENMLFVYFRHRQIDLCGALRVVASGFRFTSLMYSEEFSDLIVFLQSRTKGNTLSGGGLSSLPEGWLLPANDLKNRIEEKENTIKAA